MVSFSEREAAYLGQHRLGRLATTGTSGKPHVVPVRYRFDPEREVIRLGGRLVEGREKERLYTRHLRGNPQAAYVVDDVPDEEAWQPRGILIKGLAVLHAEGGETLWPGFGPNWIEVIPDFVTSWGLDLPTFPTSATG
ncbi:PNPOx family protein [Streptomyces geranii]|uniref:pyridoxamine 5'-phosphate oxidase family protein n=1 Tax=Streptomyces geranii TaxID=2058923 RepID=UPI00130046BA|nr:pyridoxamine 5'-phosphate oxidase family protein [Streptomyces geranii]